MINVIDFGAQGNGIHDDASAIQAAIFAASLKGEDVYFPAGRYLLSSVLYGNKQDGGKTGGSTPCFFQHEAVRRKGNGFDCRSRCDAYSHQ